VKKHNEHLRNRTVGEQIRLLEEMATTSVFGQRYLAEAAYLRENYPRTLLMDDRGDYAEGQHGNG
jgi:hypothetical protein